MTGTRYSLLEDPLIEVADDDGSAFASLPAVLERLGRDDDLEFPGIQAHHQHPWHAFLVQLAGLALHRADETDPGRSAAQWRERLSALTDDPSAWCLWVEDLERPAFLQPPVPEKSLAAFNNETAHPDRLDILVTAKNHEVKSETVEALDPLDWMRALLPRLVTYQTFNSFGGRGNYGIMRMNGGFGSRPCVSVTKDLRWATRFVRDLRVLQETRDDVIDETGFAEDDGAALLWTIPWSGKKSEMLPIGQLDPWCLEVCRRVRVALDQDRPLLHYGSTNAPRIDAKERNGNLGDPWTPIRRKDGAALTLSERGFHYRTVTDLLLASGEAGGFSPSAAQIPRDDEPPDLIAVFMALVGGQGKTGGYHERYVPIPSEASENFRDQGRLQDLAILAQGRIEQVSEVQKKVLKPALLILLQGIADDDQDLNFKDDSAHPWLDRFDAEIDRIFFRELFADARRSSSEQTERWQALLRNLAERLFKEMTDRRSNHHPRHYPSLARAESLFRYKARQVLPAAFPEEKAP